MKERIKRLLIVILIIIATITCLLLTGCEKNEEIKENTVQNIEENIVENTVEENINVTDNNVNEKYGFKSVTSDEKLTVDLENDPRPESFKIAQAAEQSLLDEGYKINLVEIGGYGTALSIDFKLSDGSGTGFTFDKNDNLYSIHGFSESDLTLIPIVRTILETKALNLSEEERNAMLGSATEYTKINGWSGYIGDSLSSTPGRIFSFSRDFDFKKK